MTEFQKTIAFVAVAAAALAAATLGGRPVEFDAAEKIGDKLTEDFDVDVPKRLEIVSFDSETAESREFEIAEESGLWRIPSKQGYPADATDQMADAATCLVGKEILRVAAKDAGQHEEFGVVDPESPGVDSQTEGVGMRVRMADANDEQLVDIIIGDEVKDAEGQRYVRHASQDVVFVVELDAEKLSTKFDDWIEDDLLQLNPFDIRKVHVNDYSAELEPMLTPRGIVARINWDRRGEMIFNYDDADSKWQIESLKKFDPAQERFVDAPLDENQELDDTALGELRTALDDLKIVDVERKPDGLSGNLKGGEDFLNNEEAVRDLMNKGFTVTPLVDGGEPEILSAEGEVTCTTREGVQYILRFGKLKLDADASAAPPANDSEDSEEVDEGIHRYLFVMAQFEEAAIERPELEDLPELPAGAEQEADSTDESDAAESESADPQEQPADETDEPAAEEEEEEELPDDSAEETEVEAAAEDSVADEAEEPPAADESAEDAADEPEDVDAIIARRKSIEQENQRKLDEYQEKIEAGRKKVQNLNERFGDWYYVIDNSVYKKIHLSRDDVTKAKESTDEDEAASDEGGSDLPKLPIGGVE